jgi:peptidoglycan/LPS O-acetylase OafA/YrhL
MLLLGAVAVAIPLLAPEQASRLRGDLVAALGYVSNWRFIFAEQSYFEAAGRPPVLQHLWSLAVEEQFYLLWPPILAFALKKRPYRSLVKPILLAAVVSTVLMAIMFRPYSDPSRVYYGTDTRAAALLIGAALACATTRWQLVDRLRRGGLVVIEVVGAVGVIGLVWAISSVSEFDPLLYRGGFLLVAVLAAAVVAASARPGRPILLGRVLGSRPLVWLGRRSYAVYLWFWPVIVLTRPHADIPLTGRPLLALRIGLTLALAALSYRFVERPAHHGALGAVWADVRRAWSQRMAPSRRSAAWGLGMSVVLACVGIGVVVGGDAVRPTKVLAQASGLNAEFATHVPSTVATTTTAVAPTTTAVTAPSTTVTTVTTTTVATVPGSLPFIEAPVTAIGDSVLLGAKPLLEFQITGITVDAEVARQFGGVLDTVRAYRDTGQLRDKVIIQTGNNGPISSGQFDQLMNALRGASKVLIVNVKVERPWQDSNNTVFAEGVARWPNAVLIDWHAITSGNPDAFVDDGLHLTPTGIRLFTGAVLNALSV